MSLPGIMTGMRSMKPFTHSATTDPSQFWVSVRRSPPSSRETSRVPVRRPRRPSPNPDSGDRLLLSVEVEGEGTRRLLKGWLRMLLTGPAARL